MRRRLAKKPELADLIIPNNFAVGCRRPTPGAGYLEALCEDNVDVVSASIEEITSKGIKTADGIEHEFDVIICATGFDVSWKPSYPTIGRESRALADEWATIPNTYLSITVPHFPNYLSKINQSFILSRAFITNSYSFQWTLWTIRPWKLPTYHGDSVKAFPSDLS